MFDVPAMRSLVAALLSLAITLAVTLGVTLGVIAAVGASDRGHGDLDLGQPTTMRELLNSPEYRNDHANVLRLYRAFFGREPDIAGAHYWIDRYSAGADEDDLAWGFAQSTEFARRYGPGLGDAAFLMILYSNVLGRSPDPEGFDYWLAQMRGGLAEHEVVRWVVANDEFVARAPFTRTSPDLTTALVAPREVDSSLVAYVIDGPAYRGSVEVELSACERPLALPSNARTVFYVEDVDRIDDMTKNAITNDVYGFSDPGRAAAMVATIKRTFSADCASFVDGFGGTNTYRNVAVPAFCETCIMWQQANTSPNFGGRVFHTRGIAIQVGYSISILEVSNWTPPTEAELTVLATHVRSRLRELITA